MRKLISRFRKGERLLKVFSCKGYLRGVLYRFEWDCSVSPNKCKLVISSSANFYEKDHDASIYRVKEYFGMGDARITSSDGYIDRSHMVIWTNMDYEEWKEAMLDEGYDEETLTEDMYHNDRMNDLWDERRNLDIKVDGVIVAFADLDLWDGHHNGAKSFGNYVKNILRSPYDYQDWYCDRYNVLCTDIHHDGTNHYIYRVAKNEDEAERLVEDIAYHEMTLEEFKKRTKSLRPYIAKEYGW